MSCSSSHTAQSPDEVTPLLQVADEIGNAILTMREESPLFQMTLARLREVLHAKSGALYLHNGTTYVLTAHSGGKVAWAQRIEAQIGQLLAEGHDDHLNGNAIEVPKASPGIPRLLLVPLVTRGAPMGGIALADTGRAVATLERDLLKLIAQLLASGLRERRLQVRLDAAHRELQTQQSWVGNTELTDALSGLANRDYFLTEIERVVAEGVQTGGHVSLLRVEIDHYTAVAESYGSCFAASVLQRVGETLLNGVRGRDLAVRFDDDEFIVLLPLTPGIGGVVVAERLRDRLSALSFEVPEGVWHLTASIGVACLSNRVVSSDELLAKSQRCLLQSKKLGGNQVFFDWDEALETAVE